MAEIKSTITVRDSVETPSPTIGSNGNWWVWDHTSGAFVDSGQPAQGYSVKKIQNFYLASASSSGVTTSTSGWSENSATQQISSAKPFLWNYEKTTLSDGKTVTTTTPVIIGRWASDGQDGGNGRGITKITEYYQLGSSGTTKPTGQWVTTPPATTTTMRFLWNYQVITYTTGETQGSSADARVIGTHGLTGATGAKGKDAVVVTVEAVGEFVKRVTFNPANNTTATTKTARGGVKLSDGTEVVRLKAKVMKGGTDVTETARTKGGLFKWYYNGKEITGEAGKAQIDLRPATYADGVADAFELGVDTARATEW